MPSKDKGSKKKHSTDRDSKGRFVPKTGAKMQQANTTSHSLLEALKGISGSDMPYDAESVSNPLGKPAKRSVSDDDFDTGEDEEEEDQSDYSDHSDGSESSDSGSDEDLPEFDTAADQNAIMLQLVATQRSGARNSDDVEIFLNNIDLKTVAKETVRLLNSRPRSATIFVPALRKQQPALNQWMSDFEKMIKEGDCTGPALAEEMWAFYQRALTLTRGHPAVASMIIVFAVTQYRRSGSDKDLTAAFNVSHRAERFIQEYCQQKDSRVLGFVERAKRGELSDFKGSILDSRGLARISHKNQFLTRELFLFMGGLIGYVTHQALEVRTDDTMIVTFETEEDADMQMTEKETVAQYKSRYEHVEKQAVEAARRIDESWRMPCEEKQVQWLKTRCSNGLWLKVFNILEQKEQKWKRLTLTEAWNVLEEAEVKRDVNADNKKEMSSRKKEKEKEKDKKSTGKAAEKTDSETAGAAAEGQQPKQPPAAPAYSSVKGLWDGIPYVEHPPGSLPRPCSHFVRDGECIFNDDCAFQHPGREREQNAAAVKREKGEKEGAGSPADVPAAQGLGGLKKRNLMMKLNSSSGSEGSGQISWDDDIDGVPEDTPQWLHRVSRGLFGQEEGPVGPRESKTVEGYSHDGWAEYRRHK